MTKAEYHKKWNKENREKLNAYMREWREKNKDRLREQRRKKLRAVPQISKDSLAAYNKTMREFKESSL